MSPNTAQLGKELAYKHVKNEIIKGSFAPGQFVTAMEVAEVLGISRTPVREAFLLLESEGFLKLVPKKGGFVPQISSREIRDTMETRQLVENFSGEKIIERRDDAVVERMAEILREQESLLPRGDLEQFIYCDRQFHGVMVEAGGNAVLTRFYSSLRDQQLRMGVLAVSRAQGRAEQVLAEHGAIVEALVAGSVEKLGEAIRRHVSATTAALQAADR